MTSPTTPVDCKALLSLCDDIYNNQHKLAEAGVVSDKMCLMLVEEIDRIYQQIDNIKNESNLASQEWNRERNSLLQEIEHWRTMFEKEKNVRSLNEQRMLQLDQMVDFIRVILAEDGADGNEPPKALSEKAVKQLWRMRSLREYTKHAPVHIRASEASCPDSEDLDKDIEYNSHMQRPRSPSYGLDGGQFAPSTTTSSTRSESEMDDESRPGSAFRAVHWGPGAVTNTSTVTLIETQVGQYPPMPPASSSAYQSNNCAAAAYESDSSCQSSSRKRGSEDSSDSYFGIKVKKIRSENLLQDEEEDDITIAPTESEHLNKLKSILEENHPTTPQSLTPSRLNRPHEFRVKNCTVRLTHCFGCGKRLTFGKSALKCCQCKVLLHPECKHLLSAPCLMENTSSGAKYMKTLLRPSLSHETLAISSSGTLGNNRTPGHHTNTLTPQSVKSLQINNSSLGLSPSKTGTSSSPSSANKKISLDDLIPLNEYPKIPSIVIQCVSEIERRGLESAGIYRVCGSDRQIKDWYAKLMRGKLNTGLSTVEDVHCIAGCLKLFLKNLTEPLVTFSQWFQLARIAETYFPNSSDAAATGASGTATTPSVIRRQSTCEKIRASCLNRLGQDGKYYLSYECLEEFMSVLEQMNAGNRDTLSYLVLHFKRVANSPACNMSVDNLCRVLSPTVVGNSSSNINAIVAMRENGIQQQVMRLLLSVPDQLYQTILSESQESNYQSGSKQQQPPQKISSSTLRGGQFFPPLPNENPWEAETSVIHQTRTPRRFFPSLYPQDK